VIKVNFKERSDQEIERYKQKLDELNNINIKFHEIAGGYKQQFSDDELSLIVASIELTIKSLDKAKEQGNYVDENVMNKYSRLLVKLKQKYF
jgi:hypothetical protein